MTYSPDSLDGTDGRQADESETADAEQSRSADSSLGVTVPDEHVGAFVAQALDDPERSTTWDEVVDAMVPPDAREDWRELPIVERASAVLSKAAEYDERAVEAFEAVSLNADRTAVHADIDEGLRCRRNADAFRDGVAAAYEEGLLDDADLVAALEDAAFDTERIARREDHLERIDGAFDVDFRPYGGTLMDTDDGPSPETDHPETW